MMLAERREADLDPWLTQAERSGLPEFKKLAHGIRQDDAAVKAAFSSEWSNGQDERYDRMKSREMSSSETRREPYQRRVVLVAATRPIVPHPPPRLSRRSRLPFALISKGGSGCAVAACHLAKLLRHHRLCCGNADGLDVRGDHLGRAGTGASVVAQ